MMSLKSLAVLCIFLQCYLNILSQNIVPNPGFEDYKHCPDTWAGALGEDVKEWKNPNGGTPDYFNKACKSFANLPHTQDGYLEPHGGDGCMGITVGLDHEPNPYCEYIEAKLLSELKKGHKYCVSMYIHMGEREYNVTNEMDIALSKEKLKGKNAELLAATNVVQFFANSFYDDKKNWVLVRKTYVAQGGEKYITIGNKFNTPPKLKYIGAKRQVYNYLTGMEGDYYFIDDVSVEEIQQNDSCSTEPHLSTNKKAPLKNDTIKVVPKLEIQPNKSIVLNNVFFESDKSELLPESYEGLDQLVNYMQENNKAVISISGYTDNTGDEEKNLKLSENRAKAVADYLISKGIDKDRISYKGYGSSNPVADNLTEEGRQKNRRVEFKIITK